MNRPHTTFYRFSFIPVLLLLLLPLAACGGGPDQGEQGEQVQDTETPAPPAPGQPQGGGRRGPKGRITLTGALKFDGDTPLDCGKAGQGLELVYNRNNGEASQVSLQIPTYSAAGDYPATVLIREGGSGREWNGTAQIDIQTREMGGKKGGGKRTALSGTFNGTYKGQGGEGTLAGNFRRCVLRDQA